MPIFNSGFRLATALALIVIMGCPMAGVSQPLGQPSRSCLTEGWAADIKDGSWKLLKPILQSGEIYRNRLYLNQAKQQRFVVDFYNGIMGGQIQVVREAGRYHAIFNYSAYNDTTEKITPTHSVITASYRVKAHDAVFYCQQLLQGDQDIA